MAYAATSHSVHLPALPSETLWNRFAKRSRKVFDALLAAQQRSAMAKVAPYLEVYNSTWNSPEK
jgi:hypothetical protein